MGGDPAASESIPMRRAAGARGGRRGRHWGDILGDCSYSCASSRRCDGRGVLGRPPPYSNNTCFVFVYHYISRRISVFALSSGVFLSSLIGGMEGKECECEEN